jgi:hypothetical protein
MPEKHTPGPWEAHAWGDDEFEVLGEKVVICDLKQEYGEKGRGMNKNIEADAKLIAASPQLLAALKAAVSRMEYVAENILIEKRHKGVSPATHVRHMASHLAQHAKIARAAIDKAEGR